MKLVKLFLYSLFLWPQLHAAAPVTHLFFAEQWIASGASYSDERKIDFMLGNLFPDIRYLGEVSRTDTHEENVSLQEISECPSPFLAGKKMHSFLDEIRETLVIQWKVYSLIEEYAEGHRAILLKLIEDEILYDQIDTHYALFCLDALTDEEKAAGVSEETLLLWHIMVYTYLSDLPSKNLLTLSEFNSTFLPVPKHILIKWAKVIPMLAQRQELIDYVRDLTRHFQDAFTERNTKK